MIDSKLLIISYIRIYDRQKFKVITTIVITTLNYEV